MSNRDASQVLAQQRPAVIVGALIIVFFTLLLVPLPTFVLDILLATNLLLAVVLLFAGMLIAETRSFFVFPTIVLLTTAYRLALNVSSTRLILTRGDQGMDAAGRVIKSFGDFVAQGDFFVGVIVFGIIACVNFLVIAKGAARVAEVSARFNLDALPGKQLAIDADLRSGTISSDEARLRRKSLIEESQFFGAMDGAMRFVQGDAIAGLAITFVNAIGGVSLGVSRGLSFGEAVETFGVLTIGDGLVSIIPSLLISLSAGLVVTRVTESDSTSEKVAELQRLFAHPPVLVGGAVVMLGVGALLVDSFLPFALVSTFVVAALYRWRLGDASRPGLHTQSMTHGLVLRSQLVTGDEPRRLGLPESPSLVADGSTVSVLRVKLGMEPRGEELERLQTHAEGCRRALSQQYGVVLPILEVVIDETLSSHSYVTEVREREVRRGIVETSKVYCSTSQRVMNVFAESRGVVGAHPLHGSTGLWIPRDSGAISSMQHLGVEVLSGWEFLVEEAYGATLEVIDELLGVEEVHRLLVSARERFPALVAEVTERLHVSTVELATLFRGLVKDNISIRDIKLILEGVADAARFVNEDRESLVAEAHPRVREKLRRGILADSLVGRDVLRVFRIAADVEDYFREAGFDDGEGSEVPSLPIEIEQRLHHSSEQLFAPVRQRHAMPIVLLCSADVRRAIHRWFARVFPPAQRIHTLSYEELDSTRVVESIGVVHV